MASFGFVKEDRVVVMHIVENPDSQNVNMGKKGPDNFFLLRVSVLGVQGYLPKVIVTLFPRFSISSTFVNIPCAPIRSIEYSKVAMWALGAGFASLAVFTSLLSILMIIII